ncbi:polysaccharide biosynthesis tyrosine autokinase [Parabacteroides merdae]|uniref:GumC family protein n=1 Tax=Parabacteroides merdae TaxID=46503 RepID=UPI00189BECD8|nr:polysaccharide biosynthesis tyrosine autokinase [Parabacteroides merdae]MDB8919639.1 polysaccharide biosynthesis tyrosine autokinase [Parabacteroides merdae]
MENRKTNNKPTDDFIRIQDLWGMFLPKWHWFALSLVVTLSVAALYILSTPNVYTRSASILVKDDSKGGSASSALSNDFADLGMFKSNTNINNELLTISSPTLMTEVVKRLGLNETYTIRKGLKRVQLYKVSPVSVMPKDKNSIVGFQIEMTDSIKFTLSDFTLEGEDVDGTVSGAFNDSIQTPVGSMYISTTQYFNEEYAGASIAYNHGSIVGTTDYYTKNLRAELGNEDATIINLSIEDASIQKAEDILNTLIEVYNEKWIQDKNQIAVSTSQFIGDRLGVIENELGHVDENISSYKSEHLLPDVQAASNLYLTQSAENKKELFALNNQLSTAQYIRRELKNKRMNQPLPSNSGIGSANIESQISEYNQMVLDRNRLIANSSEKNPLVKDLANSLQSMQNTIIQSVDNHIVSLNTQIRSIKQQEAATTQQLASNPNQAKYLLSVERQQKVKEELYLYLLQKREENELSQAFTAYNTRVITAPRGSASPTAPKKMNILLVAFVLGLLAPAVVIFMMENMNTRVRGRKDLENMNVPFVGEIPLAGGKKKKSDKKNKEDEYTIVVKEKSRNVINEAFRVVRTNLEFMAQGNKVIMVSSLNSGSGKTFITMNLATSFAIKDKKVVVVDLDMRRASLSIYVNKPKTGISNYLGGQVSDWKEMVVKSAHHANLDVIPVGTLPPNPSELLFSPKMEILIENLRKTYDLVVIDCPPVEIVADASIIAKWADMTLFIVRAGLMEREMLPMVDSYYTDRKFNNMAMLLNGTTAAYGGRYGYHRYGYRYGYHYGYGSYSHE